MNQGTRPIPEIRRLPASLDQSGNLSAPGRPAGTQLARLPAAPTIRPIPATWIANGSELTLLLPKNPKRVKAILQNYGAVNSLAIIGGEGANAPSGPQAVAPAPTFVVGAIIGYRESIVLETTAAIYGIMLDGADQAMICGVEFIADEGQS